MTAISCNVTGCPGYACACREADWTQKLAAAEARCAALEESLRAIATHELPIGMALDAIFQDIARRALAPEGEDHV